MADRSRTKIKPGGGKYYPPPSGPSLSNFKDKMSHASKWVFAILLVTIAVTSVVFFAGGPFSFGPDTGPSGGSANDAIAVVNGQAIERSALSNALSNMKQFQQMTGQQKGIADEPALVAQVMNQLVQEQVEQDAAKHSDARVSEEDFQKKLDDLVNQQLQSQESSFQSPKVFEEYLKNEGKTRDDLKSEIRQAMYDQTQSRGQDLHDVLNNELLVANFKKEKEQSLSFPRVVKYSQIVISTTPKPRPGVKPGTPASGAEVAQAEDQAKAKVVDIMKQIHAGGDFAKLAKQYSTDTASKAKGGDAGWASVTGMGAPEYLKGAAKAKVGDLLGPVKSYDGYHIIKITGEATRLPKNINPTTDYALQSAADDVYQKYLDGLVKQAKVEYKDLAVAGAVARNKGNDKVGLADYRRALAQKGLPADEKSWVAYALGQSLIIQNKAKDALPYFQQAANAAPTSADAWMATADAANKLGNKKLALASYKKALQWAAGNLMVLMNLQQQLKQLGDAADVKKAQALFQQAAATQRSSGMFGGMPGGAPGGPGGPVSAPISIPVSAPGGAVRSTPIVIHQPAHARGAHPPVINSVAPGVNNGLPGSVGGPHIIHPVGPPAGPKR